MKNYILTLQQPKKCKKTPNPTKLQTHTLGREIWQGKLKKVENLEMPSVGRGILQEN